MLSISADVNVRDQVVRKNIVNVSRWAFYAIQTSASAAIAKIQKRRWRGEWLMMTSLMNSLILLNEFYLEQ